MQRRGAWRVGIEHPHDCIAPAVAGDDGRARILEGMGFFQLVDPQIGRFAGRGDNFQARGTLNSLIDNNFPVPEILTSAKERLKTLGADQPDDAPEPAPTKSTTPKAPTKAPVNAPVKAPVKATPAPAKGKTTTTRPNLRGNLAAPTDTTQR